MQSYIVHQELEFAKIVVRPVHTLIEKQVKQIDWLYAHKYWLFSLAGGMDAALEAAKRAAKTWMNIPKKYDTANTITKETKWNLFMRQALDNLKTFCTPMFYVVMTFLCLNAY